MKRMLWGSALTVFVCLLAVSAWLVVNPRSYFADGTTSEATCKEANGGPAPEEGPVS